MTQSPDRACSLVLTMGRKGNTDVNKFRANSCLIGRRIITGRRRKFERFNFDHG